MVEKTGHSHVDDLRRPLMEGDGEQAVNIRLTFQRVKTEPVFFKGWIVEEFKRKPMPESIRRHRNMAIMFIFF